MADELKLVEFSAGGRPLDVFDLERIALGAQHVWKVKDSFKVTPGAPTNVDASGSRRWDGARTVAQKHGNAQVGARWRVSGATAQEALDNAGLFLDAVRHVRPGRYLKWRPENVPYPTYFELRGPGEWTPDYSHIIFAHNYALYVDASWPVAPLAELDRMDVYDDFSVDSIADWTYDTGAGLDAVVGGALTVASSATTIRRSRHTARGYRHTDGQATRRFTPGATITGFNGGVHLCDDGLGDRIAVYVDDDGANSRLRIDTVIAGTTTNRASVNLAARVQNGVPLWVRGRREGNLVFAEHRTAPPALGGAATTVAPAGGVGYVLTSAEQAAIPDGFFGTRWTPMHAAATVDEYEDLPFTYNSRLLPDRLSPFAVPGDDGAPAKLDLSVLPFGGAAIAVWALLAWWRKPDLYNLVWNGDFGVDVHGWSVGGVSGVTGAASSLTRVTSAAKVKYGVASGEIVTPASANTGAAFALYGRFRKGVTYTAELWVNSAAQTTLTRLRLGLSGDIASETAAALSSTLTRRTVSWTPAADQNVAYVAFEVTAATATTMAIDGVMVYEGTVAPTGSEQREGRGGAPPVGVLPAESAENPGGWSIGADGNFRGGFGLISGSLAVPNGGMSADWVVDPSLVAPDDFVGNELDIEVWARIYLSSTVLSPVLTLAVVPFGDALWGPPRFTAEYGSAGKLLTKPSSGSVFRIARLGTLTFYVDRRQPQRQRLQLKAMYGLGSSGNFSIDQLYLAPIDRRAVSGPTGQPLDGAYPRFAGTTSGVRRLFKSDGSGLSIKPGEGPYPAPGLSRPLEVESGDLETLVLLSTLVPDDPTVNTASEQEDHSADVHFALTPRVHLARGS